MSRNLSPLGRSFRDEYLLRDNFLSYDMLDRFLVRNLDFLTRSQDMTGLSYEHAKKIVRKTSKTASSTNTLWQFLKVTKSRILRFYVTLSNVWGGKISRRRHMYKYSSRVRDRQQIKRSFEIGYSLVDFF